MKESILLKRKVTGLKNFDIIEKKDLESQGIKFLSVNGYLDAHTVNQLEEKLYTMINSGIKKILIDFAINKNVNVDWLLTGDGKIFNISQNSIAEPTAKYSEQNKLRRITDNEAINNNELLRKAAHILKSDALHRNTFIALIETCHHSVLAEEKLIYQDERIKALEDEISLLAGTKPPAVNG